MPLLDTFIGWYLCSASRHVHEILRPGYPCRLFMDIDDPKNTPEFSNFVTNLEQITKRFIKEDFGIDDPQPFYLKAHRPEKQSLHIIYENVIFGGFEMLQPFMEKVSDAVKRDQRLDLHVYSKETCRRLRIAFSSSWGKKNPLIPINDSECIPSKEVLLRTLLTINTNNTIVKAPALYRAVSTDIENLHDDALERIFDWLKQMYNIPQSKIYKKHISSDFSVLMINPPLPCKVAGGIHKSQSTYFYVRFHGLGRITGYFQCADSTCSHVKIPYEANLDALVNPNINNVAIENSAKRIKLDLNQ